MSTTLHRAIAIGLLVAMFFLAGASALHESPVVDEISHVASGLSYWQRFDLRLNPEHPPLAKILAGLPLAAAGTRADYTGPAWHAAADFLPAYLAQWPFGNAVLGRLNPWKPTLMWARFPMLILTLLLGWCVYHYATRLGGAWAGLLCLAVYITTPAFLVFGPLVLTDLPVTLFSLIALWRLGNIWAVPSRRNALLFGVALAAAVLSKFTGLLLVLIVLVLFIQTRFWPTSEQPATKPERELWRRARWRAVLLGVLCSVLCVYVVYSIFSWNQPDDALNRLGSGPWAFLIRRPLMPFWLYIRGVLLMLLSASRSTYLFGHTFAHGVPFYFPVVFALKSTLGFLLLLVVAAVLGILHKFKNKNISAPVIPAPFRPHWRVLMIGFFVFLIVCLLSRLDLGIRHFLSPDVLLILMLAPLPRLLQTFPRRRILEVLTVVLALSCFPPILLAFPYFFPYVNALAFGRPVYYLLNDSNVSWNEALPAVEQFARERHLNRLPLDWASLSDPTLVVPQAEAWDCQNPGPADAGQWVAVAAVSLLENHNCGYLLQYPHRPLAGGSFYAFQLPASIPPPGSAAGPPLPSERKLMWGIPMDLRSWIVNVEHHPEQLPTQLSIIMQKFQQQRKAAP